jgi:hypothetical protein
VLIHGAYHGPWCWDRLIPELEARGHTALAVDLPIAEPGAGAAVYAQSVLDAASDIPAPVLVGHSMAGTMLPLVAGSRRVAKMVFLAAFIPEVGMSLADQRAREPIDPDVEFQSLEFTDIGDGVYTVGAATAREMFFYDVPPRAR